MNYFALLNGMMLGLTSKTKNDIFYLKFISNSSFTLKTANLSKNWNDRIYYYDNFYARDIVWNGEELPAFKKDDKWQIWLFGLGNTRLVDTSNSGVNASNGRWVFTGTDSIITIGHIEQLVDCNKFINEEDITYSTYSFAYLFKDCTLLKIPPQLPQFTVMGMCNGMFLNCTSLAIAPKLQATEIKSNAYNGMFQNCTSLKLPPKILASRIGERGCSYMFSGCTNLEQLPKLQATVYGPYGCIRMFSGCSKIKISETQNTTYNNVYRIPATGTATVTSDEQGLFYNFNNMFENTGGIFTGTPTINTEYYTSNIVI